MTTTPANNNPTPIAAALVEGDLSKLTHEDRLQYYRQVCESLGLNPLTKPFQYIRLQGKLTLYCTRDAADQLRQLHKISITLSAGQEVRGCYVVRASATTPDGRTDESTGAVELPKNPKDQCNAIMKAETKAKRRVTLSICGLGWLDETERDTLPPTATAQRPKPQKPRDAMSKHREAKRTEQQTSNNVKPQIDAAWKHIVSTEESSFFGETISAVYQRQPLAMVRLALDSSKPIAEADRDAALKAYMSLPVEERDLLEHRFISWQDKQAGK